MLRRTVSFDDLGHHTVEPSAPVYRNPERDLFSDEQSMLDRLSLDNHPKFTQPEQQYDTKNEPTPQKPAPREITATFINGEDLYLKFDGLNCAIPVKDWLFRFEYRNNIKNLPEDTKKNKLIKSLGGDAENFVFRALKDEPNRTYDDLKKLLIEGFTSQFEPTVCFYKLVDKTWKKDDTLWTYWNDKLSLMEKVDPNFSFTTKKNLLIMGLPTALRQMVNAQILLYKPTSLNSLYQIIEAMYTIMTDGEEKSQKARQNTNPKPFSKVDKPPNTFQKNKNQYQQGNRTFQRQNNPNRNQYNNNNNNFNNNYPNRRNQNQNFNPNRNSNLNNNQNRNPNRNQQAKPSFQWSEDGQPICNICSEVGHMKRNCPKNANQEN